MNRHKHYQEYKTSKNRLERTVYWIAQLSPHNYWKGVESLEEIQDEAIKAEMNKMMNKDNFYQALKDNPKDIITWCEREIKEYKKLIKLIKDNQQEDE